MAGRAVVAAPAAAQGAGRDLRADARRNRSAVLAVARRMLDGGDGVLAMNVVARRAGLGVGTVYRHFPTRQALLEELAQGSFEHLLVTTRSALADPDPDRGLPRVLRAAIERLLEDPALGLVLRCRECAREETSQVLAELLGLFDEVLARAREAGAARPDVTPDDLRRYLLGLEVTVRLSGHDGAASPRADRDLEVLVAGLRAGS